MKNTMTPGSVALFEMTTYCPLSEVRLDIADHCCCCDYHGTKEHGYCRYEEINKGAEAARAKNKTK